MSTGTMLFNPFTGKPRHPSDIASDPRGELVWDGEESLKAAAKKPGTLPTEAELDELEGFAQHYVEAPYGRFNFACAIIAWYHRLGQ